MLKLVDCQSGTIPIRKIKELLACAVWAPTEEKLSRIMDEVYSDSNASLYVLVDHDMVLGIVGIKRTGTESAEIIQIAVDEKRRKQGIGRKLLDELLVTERLTELVAETDQDAVNFYRAYGFTIHSLGEKYPGVERFLCRFNLQS